MGNSQLYPRGEDLMGFVRVLNRLYCIKQADIPPPPEARRFIHYKAANRVFLESDVIRLNVGGRRLGVGGK